MFSFKMKWVTLKSLFKGPDTRRFPSVVREPFAGTRGRLVFDKSKCTVCTLCEKRCPTHALKVDRKARTWALDRHLCILCGECVDSCNKAALRLDERYFAPVAQKGQGVESYDVPAPPAPAAPAAVTPSAPPAS
jgi:formate hydrogenlyase subunit 6/NADH:ubiquinone oxidoreductase subunit I